MAHRERVIGSTVHALATRIFHKTECGRLCRSLRDKKEIDGKVLEVIPAEKGSKKQASPRVEWISPGKKAVKEVEIESAKTGSHCASDSRPPEPHLSAASQIATDLSGNCAPKGGFAQTSAGGSACPPAAEPSIQEAAQSISVKRYGCKKAVVSIFGCLNGSSSSQWWEAKNQAGNPIYEGSNPIDMKPIDCFCWMLPMQRLPKIASMADLKL